MYELIAGTWRDEVKRLIAECRQRIADAHQRQRRYSDALDHVSPHSTQDGTLRDMLREAVAEDMRDEILLRRLRGLLQMTRDCPRCKGRGQTYDRRRKRFSGAAMRPCNACRAKGAIWVKP